MALSTATDGKNPPKGMMAFTVVRSTIKDSLGCYCTVGDKAVLTKDLAQHYLDKKFIRVELPDFDEEDFDGDDTSAGTDADTGTTPERGEQTGPATPDNAEQPEVKATVSADAPKGRARR